MKNIHVLSTKKPSKLLKDIVDKTYQLKKEVTFGNRIEVPLNIYITDVFKKIILTTDQDLINDRVQPIPDEFLEWFVKNPSCDFVEVVFNNRGIKIIIPKEETLKEVVKVERTELFNSIFSVVKQIPRKDVNGDAIDAISCAYEIEQLFYKWQQEQDKKCY